jgi:hypothetical protein
MTHLAGILIFHGLFLVFGFAAARALTVVLLMLLGGGAIYSIVILQYSLRLGDLMRDGYLHDVFGIGDPAVFVTFHQNIGELVGFATLAALGLGSNRIRRILAIGTLPLVLLFMFHIAARTGLVAIVCGLIFWMSADLWIRSKKLAMLGIVAVIVTFTVASVVFYQHALHDKGVDAVAPDTVSRTIREIQDPRPGFRTQIWTRAWHHVSTEPDRLLFGRGIGMFPVTEGFGAPDWLLHPTEGSKHYPHNVHLEVLYDTGIVGLVLFSVLTILPIVASLRRWSVFSREEKSAVAIYVFILVSSDISGSFAFTYMLQFFLALTVGVFAIRRADDAALRECESSKQELDRSFAARVHN